eukprot:205633_1
MEMQDGNLLDGNLLGGNLLVQNYGNLLRQNDDNLLGQNDGNLLGQNDGNLLGQNDGNLLGQNDGNLLGQNDGNLLGGNLLIASNRNFSNGFNGSTTPDLISTVPNLIPATPYPSQTADGLKGLNGNLLNRNGGRNR